jgi:hypothetical protein
MALEAAAPELRFCRRCGVDKPIMEFDHRSGNRSHQVKSWCHVCTRAYYNARMPEYYHRNSATIIANKKARHHANPLNILFGTAKRRAKRDDLLFTITKDDIRIPELCPLLGIPLKVHCGRPGDGSPTLDRIDNTKGYIPGNVWVISYKANTIKSNASLQELEMLVNNLRKKLTARLPDMD